jgi:hypothetical protein
MTQRNSLPPAILSSPPAPVRTVVEAVQDIQFGTVEVVVHDGQIMEVRQTHRTRLPNETQKLESSDI